MYGNGKIIQRIGRIIKNTIIQIERKNFEISKKEENKLKNDLKEKNKKKLIFIKRNNDKNEIINDILNNKYNRII